MGKETSTVLDGKQFQSRIRQHKVKLSFVLMETNREGFYPTTIRKYYIDTEYPDKVYEMIVAGYLDAPYVHEIDSVYYKSRFDEYITMARGVRGDRYYWKTVADTLNFMLKDTRVKE